MIHYNYLILENNKPVYVGARSTVLNNSKYDFKYMGTGILIKKVIREKGLENFTKEILCEGETRIKVENWERFFINWFGTKIPQGYNIDPNGGNRRGGIGMKFSKEQCENISKGHIGQIAWNKGLTKETDERIKRYSKSIKGKKGWNKGLTKEMDERVKRNGEFISKSLKGISKNKGKKNPMFGKTHSEEVKEKMSELRKGKKHSEQAKRKMSESKKNMSKETKRKMSIAQRGEKNPNYGKKASKETRKKIRENHKGMSGKNHSEKTKQKIGKSMRGNKNTVKTETIQLTKKEKCQIKK